MRAYLLTQIGIARELGAPTDKGGAGKLSRGYGPETDGIDDAGVGQLGLGVDDTKGNEVLEGLRSRKRVNDKRSLWKDTVVFLRCARPA